MWLKNKNTRIKNKNTRCARQMWKKKFIMLTCTMKKRGVLQLALQLTMFIHCECYRTSCKSCKSYNLPYIWCNSITTLSQKLFSIMQFPYDYNYNVMLMWFLSIHQKFNTWHYEDFLWFFKILISIVHYDYSF